MKSFIRNLSAPAEFCLVIFTCFGLSIFASSRWIIHHLSSAPPPPASNLIRLNNHDIIVSVVLELITLGLALWIGVGVLLFFTFLLIQRVFGLITRNIFHSTVDFHRVSHLTVPFNHRNLDG